MPVNEVREWQVDYYLVSMTFILSMLLQAVAAKWYRKAARQGHVKAMVGSNLVDCDVR